ncbi:uncharacterized protein LOC127847904 [Dreissena polymorpha]|uniref:B box-type domain-containing protein n=1 Tax=Dreissena polymorpha TaxID=45954 RepID=A0A9D4DDE1_DREPO|nr:uncharacterized protein LOC127847904 [Dreissena polymorpha]KAH3746480.1 hypothetical protein DPMN_180888 [Dreissena polymorpha]
MDAKSVGTGSVITNATGSSETYVNGHGAVSMPDGPSADIEGAASADAEGTGSGNEEENKPAGRRWRGPPKNSSRYGIKHSLQRMAVKYTPPKIEGPKKPLHACAPCAREHLDVDASSYCSDCKEKLCSGCSAQHRRFLVLKTHKLVGLEEAPKAEVVKVERIKLTETCATHANKLLDLYCRSHDQVACSACIALSHKGCGEPEYVSTIAADLLKTGLQKVTNDELSRVKKDIFLLKLRRLADKNRFTKAKDDILVTIEGIQKQVMEIFDKLAQSARDKLTTHFDKQMGAIKGDIKSCDNAIASLEDSIKKTKAENDAQLLINIKRDCRASLEIGEQVLIKVTERLGQEDVKFTVDNGILEWLRKLTALGKFEHEVSIYSGIFFGKSDLDQKSDTEKENYVFNNLLNLPNGFTIVSDWKNKRLKILDTNYNLRNHCDTPGEPYALCSVQPNMIAVTLRDEKIIQFVSLDNTKMKLDRKFKIDEYCRGIACKNNQLFITCGGGEGEIHGQLRVYSLHGALVCVFEEDIQGKPFFGQPKDVVINDEGTRFHVADLKRGVVTISPEGRLLSIFHDPGLVSPLGLCMDGKGNLFVSGCESNNVIQFTGEGKKLSEVLNETDGLTRPLAICCHESVIPRLVVASEDSCTIKVYTLQEKL